MPPVLNARAKSSCVTLRPWGALVVVRDRVHDALISMDTAGTVPVELLISRPRDLAPLLLPVHVPTKRQPRYGSKHLCI